MNRTQLNIAFGVAASVLTFSSFVLVLKGATDEPYETYRASDAFEQIVIGTALIVLWGSYSLAVVAIVICRQMSRSWLAIILWAAICPFGYLYDLEHIILPAMRGP
jgi:hypothetical protein